MKIAEETESFVFSDLSLIVLPSCLSISMQKVFSIYENFEGFFEKCMERLFCFKPTDDTGHF